MKRFLCRIGLHRWTDQPMVPNTVWRGLTGHRLCTRCGKRQGRSSIRVSDGKWWDATPVDPATLNECVTRPSDFDATTS